ncbi:MAG: gamma-glutamyl-gamma-aminobutyrate hydrolase family protein [Bacteroidetes bacterium]|nr:gamma-glutamyl-gamma-aminobutyrate hydrolase family protein [Bacteroidota bacterium]MBU2584152.1 gamma-glutamyl-gamma-aminobutyrate hydrolase family protein [Bacteroidota bacterium]
MIKIGLSYYGSKIQNYINWLKSFDQSIEIVKLSYGINSPQILLECTSLLLPGGGDIDPTLYGEDNSEGLSKKIDNERDKFESVLFDLAVSNQKPVLAICRGLQLANVHLGGTLFQDIPDHKSEESDSNLEIVHSIKVEEKSLLFDITKNKTGNVNSSHHQAVNSVAPELKVTSMSNDGIIESLEWRDNSGRSPMLLIQWHSERMIDREQNYFSKNILEWFINIQK